MRDLKERTTGFAVRIVRLYTALPKTTEAQVLGKQLLLIRNVRWGHYREATRSLIDGGVCEQGVEGGLQELAETSYWLELLVETEIVPAKRLDDLIREADELTAILVTCARNAKARGLSK